MSEKKFTVPDTEKTYGAVIVKEPDIDDETAIKRVKQIEAMAETAAQDLINAYELAHSNPELKKILIEKYLDTIRNSIYAEYCETCGSRRPCPAEY